MRWLLVIALAACSRKQVSASADSVDAAQPPPSVSTTAKALIELPPAIPSVTAPAAPEPEPPKPKLVPFLSIAAATIPPGAYDRPAEPFAKTYAPKGFDPLKAPKGQVFHLPGGHDVHAFQLSDGASDFKDYVAVTHGGKVTNTFDYVYAWSVDTAGGHLALNHARPDATGKKVRAREILDVASGSISPLPNLPCVDGFQFVDGRLLAMGYVFDKPYTPHAWICVFDVVGKLMVNIDAGLHNHHAASIDFINWRVGALAKQPAVIWALREYENYGNYDITLIDTNPPHARKYARLPTPGQLGSTTNLELDLAETTMASDEIKFRGKSPEGWWWKWQTAKLQSDP
jgi:hypothetical protein